MKKLFVLLLALALALTLPLYALAEGAEESAEVSAEAVETAEEAASEAEGAAVSTVFDNLVSLPWYTWVILALLVVAGAILSLNARNNRWGSRRLAMGAMCVAIAFVLSCIVLFRLPQGGIITPAGMLPLVLFMLACGPLHGFVVGCTYGLLLLITDPFVIHPVQLLMDYPLAFGAMILCCLANRMPIKKQWRLPVGVLLAGLGNYIMAVLSGAIFFAEYAGDQNAWIYSLTYNIAYLGPNVLICMLVAFIPGMSRLVDVIAGKKQ